MTKALKYFICALAFVVVLASCTKDSELIEQAREELNTKSMHVTTDVVSDEPDPTGAAATTVSTRNGEGETSTDDGTGITDDEDDEDDDDGSSVKASNK